MMSYKVEMMERVFPPKLVFDTSVNEKIFQKVIYINPILVFKLEINENMEPVTYPLTKKIVYWCYEMPGDIAFHKTQKRGALAY